jgi:hypothetical protein
VPNALRHFNNSRWYEFLKALFNLKEIKKKIEGNKLRKQIDEFGLKLVQIHPSIFIIFIFILFAFFPQNQTHQKRSCKAANVNCIIMAPQPACWCVWCWQRKVWCELWISKLHAYTTYDIYERTVIACEQNMQREREREEQCLVVKPTCKCMRTLHSYDHVIYYMKMPPCIKLTCTLRLTWLCYGLRFSQFTTLFRLKYKRKFIF